MESNHQTFWHAKSYAVVGHSARTPFPKLTYGQLKKNGLRVFAVDPEAKSIEGDPAFADLASLPERVEAVVLEVPKEETREWIGKAADAGVKDVWIHQNRDTPEALALAGEKGINVRTGNCAVMYVTPGFTYHSIHKVIQQLRGKY